MKKCVVNGEFADPAYTFLREKSSLHGDYILWNFTKFMVNKHGQVLSYYKFDTSPELIIPEIEILCEVFQSES
jgi:glutathione peroxidase